jgi:uncharacterized surface protein with fasciclin (FAS1) repeats
MRTRTVFASLLAVSALVTVAACSDDSDSDSAATTAPAETTAAPAETTAAPAMMDIVDTAVGAGSFTTLATLLTDAGLVETLKGEGPFTVFAPTDEAFAKVDPATLEALAANPDALKQVLLYHVVSGAKVMSSDVAAGAVEMASGDEATLAVDGGVTIDGANVVTPDVEASNGVIHVIDAVIIPAGLEL